MVLFKSLQRQVLLVFFAFFVGLIFSSCDRLCGGCSEHIEERGLSFVFVDTLLGYSEQLPDTYQYTVTEYGPYYPEETSFYLEDISSSVPIRYVEWDCRNNDTCSYYFKVNFNNSLFKGKDTITLLVELEQGVIDTLTINTRNIKLMFNGQPPIYEGTPFLIYKP